MFIQRGAPNTVDCRRAVPEDRRLYAGMLQAAIIAE
jgi:hypothetical protein